MASASCSVSAIGFSTTTCLPALAQAMTCSRMHSARGEHGRPRRCPCAPGNRRCRMRRHAESRRDGVGALAHGIADRDQARACDVIAAQQIGVALGDTPAPEQAESDHWASFAASRGEVRRPVPRDRRKAGIDPCSILRKAAANQGVSGRIRPLPGIGSCLPKDRRRGRRKQCAAGCLAGPIGLSPLRRSGCKITHGARGDPATGERNCWSSDDGRRLL